MGACLPSPIFRATRPVEPTPASIFRLGWRGPAFKASVHQEGAELLLGSAFGLPVTRPQLSCELQAVICSLSSHFQRGARFG